MDSHVKERIVGAAVLVALGVWLIPWVLDGPEESPGQSDAASPLSLPPGTDTMPVRTETVELDVRGNTREPVTADAFASTEPTAVAIVTPQLSESFGNSLSSSVTETVSEPRAGSSVAETVTPPASDWAVQVGAFGDIANANQLVTRVSTFGYSAFVSEFRSGGATTYRVRVGGLGSEGEAEAAADALSARGVPVLVIPPE